MSSCPFVIGEIEARMEWCQKVWQLSNVCTLKHEGTARVVFCDSPSGRAVLKLSTEPDMIRHECAAVQFFGSELCPNVYEYSEERQALLLERVGNGDDLTSVYPDPNAEVAAFLSLFEAMPEGSPEGYPRLCDWSSVFGRVRSLSLSNEEQEVMEIADRHRAVLFDNCELRLLHGDMHHYNILASNGGWKLIDPHGVIGNPLYELGAFLRNPLGFGGHPQMEELAAERVRILAQELSETEETVALFGFYGVAIGMAWDLEQGEKIEPGVHLARTYLELAAIER